jgi:thiol-disulfide isomerase/thioredoxin
MHIAGVEQAPIVTLYWWTKCGHCTRYKPEWDEIAKEHNGNGMILRAIEQSQFPNGVAPKFLSADTGKVEELTGFPTVTLQMPGQKYGQEIDRGQLKAIIANLQEESNVPVVTLYWWTNCGHCIQYKPEWERLKQENNGKGIYLRDIERSQFPNGSPPKFLSSRTGKLEQLRGFPTVTLQMPGEKEAHEIDRNQLEHIIAEIRHPQSDASASSNVVEESASGQQEDEGEYDDNDDDDLSSVAAGEQSESSGEEEEGEEEEDDDATLGGNGGGNTDEYTEGYDQDQSESEDDY